MAAASLFPLTLIRGKRKTPVRQTEKYLQVVPSDRREKARWQISTMQQSRCPRSSRTARARAAARRPAQLPSWAAAWRSWPVTLKIYLWAPSDLPCPPPCWTSTRPSGCPAASPAWVATQLTRAWPLTGARGQCAGTRTVRTPAVPLLSTMLTWRGWGYRPATWSFWPPSPRLPWAASRPPSPPASPACTGPGCEMKWSELIEKKRDSYSVTSIIYCR